jgi:hypothetical protein
MYESNRSLALRAPPPPPMRSLAEQRPLLGVLGARAGRDIWDRRVPTANGEGERRERGAESRHEAT